MELPRRMSSLATAGGPCGHFPSWDAPKRTKWHFILNYSSRNVLWAAFPTHCFFAQEQASGWLPELYGTALAPGMEEVLIPLTGLVGTGTV